MLKGLLFSILSAACYGASPILYKLGFAAGLRPLDLLQYRFVVAALLILAYLGLTRPALIRPAPITVAKAALSGVVLYCMQSYFFLMALRYIPAATTSLILYLYPVVVTLASAAIFRKRPDRIVWLSLAVILAGSGFVSYDAFDRTLDSTGILYACGAMLVFSTYMITTQLFMKGENPLTFTLYVLASVAATWAVLHEPAAILRFDGRQILICLLAGLVPTALAVPLLYMAIDRIGSAYVSIFSTFEPVATIVMAGLILGEDVNMHQLLGMGLIVAGIVLPNASLLRIRDRVSA